jgi:hypothetical protein
MNIYNVNFIVSLAGFTYTLSRSILGSGGWVATTVRTEGQFSFVALAQQVGKNLTRKTWLALLRFAKYLVSTKHLHLYLRADGPGGPADWVFAADSSAFNEEHGGSFGGYVGYYEGSGAFAWACIVPRFFTDATGGAELVTASRCVKAMLGWRIFTRELGCATPRENDLLEDNRAVLDGTESSLDRLSKESRYVCARYAMLRAAKDG